MLYKIKISEQKIFKISQLVGQTARDSAATREHICLLLAAGWVLI